MKNFAIVGLGAISELHAKAITSLDGCSLAGGFAQSETARDNFAKKWNSRAYSDIEAVCADPKIDIVVVCTPSGAHFEPAMMALSSGKHVIVEKPLEISLDKCDALVKKARSSSLLLGSVFQSRFYTSTRLVKEALDRSRFGRLSLVQADVHWYRSQEYYSASRWRGNWALSGGGAYMNQAIHMIDLIRWLIGEPDGFECETATLSHDSIEVEDTAVSILRWEGRCLGAITATTAAYPGYLKRLKIMGMKGSIAMEEDRITEWRFEDETEEDERIKALFGVGSLAGSEVTRFEPEEAAHARQYANFLAALEGKEKLLIDGEEARRSVKLVLDLYRSAKKKNLDNMKVRI